MSELADILARLDRLDQRLARLETQASLGTQSLLKPNLTSDVSTQAEVRESSVHASPGKAERLEAKSPSMGDDAISNGHTNESTISDNEQAPNLRDEPEGRNLLGVMGVVCFGLAALLLVKFSIASGWLTPMRQLLLAALIGFIFTLSGFLQSLADRRYMSQLPATGIIILNLAAYGGVFYHKLIDPMMGLCVISIIGLWSLVLLQYLRRDLFALMSVVGVYTGAFVFSNSFELLSRWGVFLIFWSAIFGTFSIWSKRRTLIFIAGYLALGIFGLKAANVISATSVAENLQLVVSVISIQCVLFLIFAVSTVVYSIHHRSKLESIDSWLMLPLILFFYGQIYYFTMLIGIDYASGFAAAFVVVLYALYSFAKAKLSGDLASRNMVFSTISLVALHAAYFARFSDNARVASVLVSGFAFLLYQPRNNSTELSTGAKLSIAVMAIDSFLLVLWGYSNPETNLATAWAFGILGILYFIKLRSPKFTDIKNSLLPDVVLALGNLQIATAIWRMKEYISEAAVAPLWMVFATGLMIWAVLAKSAKIARHALFFVCLAFFRFMFFQFFDLSTENMIISLFLIGALVFGCGYLYRYALRRSEEN